MFLRINAQPTRVLLTHLTKRFSTVSELYPDQIVSNLRSLYDNQIKDADKWTMIEVDIINKIHFFDSDQYVDIVTMFARVDKGTDNLWNLLSRKIFDYQIDLAQTEELRSALKFTSRPSESIYEVVIQNSILKNNHSSNEWKEYKKLYYH